MLTNKRVQYDARTQNTQTNTKKVCAFWWCCCWTRCQCWAMCCCCAFSSSSYSASSASRCGRAFCGSVAFCSFPIMWQRPSKWNTLPATLHIVYWILDGNFVHVMEWVGERSKFIDDAPPLPFTCAKLNIISFQPKSPTQYAKRTTTKKEKPTNQSDYIYYRMQFCFSPRSEFVFRNIYRYELHLVRINKTDTKWNKHWHMSKKFIMYIINTKSNRC